MYNILIIDDDQELCLLIKRSILSEDIEADFCNTGKAGLQKLKEKQYQLVILDVMMPGMDGFETLEKIRKESSLPILMFTSKNDSASKVRGLRAGADDYLTKPFRIAELRARINAHLRREKREKHRTLNLDKIRIDLSAKAISVDNKPIAFTKSEYLICEYLASNKGQVFSKEQIYEATFSFYGESDSSTISTHIKNIRAKFKKMGVQPISTVWGIGYKWE